MTIKSFSLHHFAVHEVRIWHSKNEKMIKYITEYTNLIAISTKGKLKLIIAAWTLFSKIITRTHYTLRYLRLGSVLTFERLHNILSAIKQSLVFRTTHYQKMHFRWFKCCRSTPARHAASPFQPERHPNAQGKTQTLHTFY